MNRAKNPVCAMRRTHTKLRMMRRAGMPEPGRLGSIFLGLAAALGGVATAVADTDTDADADARRGVGTALVVAAGRGVGTLSGGQMQRSAAARMFVREPELLVVDDLSSALDVETDAVAGRPSRSSRA